MFDDRPDIRAFLAALLRQTDEQAEQSRRWNALQSLRLSIPEGVMEDAEARRQRDGPADRWASLIRAERLLNDHAAEMTAGARSRWRRAKALELPGPPA